MGWKNVKEHYDIRHIVQVRPEKGICIGSAYMSEIIIIDMQGNITKRYSDKNEDLLRYLQEMDAAPDKLRELVQTPDKFGESITVYTYDAYRKGGIIEKQCEKLGWPNVTHDGELMYENLFFTDRDEAIKAGHEESAAGLKATREWVERKEQELSESQAALAKHKKIHAKFEEMLKETSED